MSSLPAARQLDILIQKARELGVEVRFEVLEGNGADICRVKDKTYLFLNLMSDAAEQLESLGNVLGNQT